MLSLQSAMNRVAADSALCTGTVHQHGQEHALTWS